MADGAAVRLWRMGQEYWKENHQAIPKQCFDLLGCARALLESGLAVLDGDWVHVRGAGKAYEWLEKRKAAAAKGGKVSAQRSRDSLGKLQAKAKQEPSKTQANDKQTQASYSYSSSFSERKKTITGIRHEYPENFSQVWKAYGGKGDKVKARDIFLSQKLTDEEFNQLTQAITNYVAERSEKQYRKDFERFLQMDWREFCSINTVALLTRQELLDRGFDPDNINHPLLKLKEENGAV